MQFDSFAQRLVVIAVLLASYPILFFTIDRGNVEVFVYASVAAFALPLAVTVAISVSLQGLLSRRCWSAS